jgi:hypothetical protein
LGDAKEHSGQKEQGTMAEGHQDSGDTIEHEAEVEAAVNAAQATEAAGLTNAVASHTVSGTFSNTEIKGFLDALGAKINTIIAVLKT